LAELIIFNLFIFSLQVGNLSFFTSESQIREVFEIVGPVKRVIMGLNSITKQPCGFCFVEYYTRENTEACLKYVSGTVCDDRIIRCDLDAGFKPGRQFGRGKSGGQVRDERRRIFDTDRGDIKPAIPPGLGKRGREVFISEPENKVETIHQKLERGLTASRSSPSVFTSSSATSVFQVSSSDSVQVTATAASENYAMENAS
jgi:nuclear cap-binding protein subunit 2